MNPISLASTKSITCRIGCGACCIAPSISSAMPNHPYGKKAGIRCANLDAENKCKLFGKPEPPDVCMRFQATEEFCGTGNEEAFRILTVLENLTQ